MGLPFEYKHTRITKIFFMSLKKYPQSYPHKNNPYPLPCP